MAADNSPPRIQPIAITAFIAVMVLVGLKFVFDSYYVTMFEAEQYRKIGSVEPTELLALHAAEKKSLAGAAIPIDRAIQLVAKGRAEPIPGLKDIDITPAPSTDDAPLMGWASLGKASATPTTPAASGALSASPSPTGSATTPAGSASANTAASGSPPGVPVPGASSSAAAPVHSAAGVAPVQSSATPTASSPPPSPPASAAPPANP